MSQRTIQLALAGLLLLAAAAAAPAAPPEQALGLWQTETHHGTVRITPCGQSVCGVLVSSDKIATDPGLADGRNTNPALRSRTLAGLQILGGFVPAARGWKGGTIYNPDDGHTYHARLTLIDPQHMRVRGCVFFPLCQSQIWARVSPPAR